LESEEIFDRAMTRLALIFPFVVALALVGCAKPAGEIFPKRNPPLVWPPPPERARIMYIGQLAASADLKPAVPFGQGFGNAVFGKQPIKSMLTPYALCTDGKDRLFVADSNAQLVHVFDLKTRKYAQWRPGGSEKRFSQPVGIAYDPSGTGRLFVADSAAATIFVFDAKSSTSHGTIGSDFLQRPCGMAFDAVNRRLFVADSGSHQVVVLSIEGNLLDRLGRRGTALGQFNFPTNVALDSQGRLYVSDSLNFRIQQFGPDLRAIRQIGRKGDMPGYFGQPKGVAVDSENHLYVVDANFENVQIFDDAGNVLMDFGNEGRGDGQFWLPAGLFIDNRNRIWIADSYNRRVQVFQYLPEGGRP
jgi:DNA-binding beta-propeller fold protein YncE